MMHIVRPIKQEEYAAAKAVWDRCFPEDAGDYSAFYFTCRTRPEYILAAFSPEGKMIGTLHALPYPLRFGETVKRCALVTGVATLPEYRMRGVAAAMLRRSETWLREKGIAAAVLKPDADIYGPFGYRPFGWHDLYRVEAAVLSEEMPAELFVPDAKHMLRCYEKFAKNYNGMMVRTEADMENILLEAKAAGGKVIAAPGAYGVLYEGKTEDSLSELAGDDILPFLAALSRAGKSLRFRLPEGLRIPGLPEGERMMFSMLCPIDAAALLEGTGTDNLETLLSGAKKQNCTIEFC
ncbi:MAG: GNAT family N-acetyltransferase [Clostridiales bacterium]|nr:GNAT family N-acetyltransferase [Clostridiales bacterium]